MSLRTDARAIIDAAIRAADHVTASLAGHGVRAALERFGLLG